MQTQVRGDLNADVYVGADDEAIKRMARITVWDTRKTIWLRYHAPYPGQILMPQSFRYAPFQPSPLVV